MENKNFKIANFDSNEEELKAAYKHYVKVIEENNHIVSEMLNENGFKYGIAYCKHSDEMGCNIIYPNHFSCIDVKEYDVWRYHLIGAPYTDIVEACVKNDEYTKMYILKPDLDYEWCCSWYTYGEYPDVAHSKSNNF